MKIREVGLLTHQVEAIKGFYGTLLGCNSLLFL